MTIADELEPHARGNHDPLALTSPLPITKDGRDPLRLEAIALLDAYAKAYAGANNHGLEIERPTVGTLAKWMASREFTAAETAEIQERLRALYQAPAQLLLQQLKIGNSDMSPVSVGVVVFCDPDDPDQMDVHTLSDIFLRWDDAKSKGLGLLHPMAPVMKAWFASRPRPAETSKRETKRIIPARLAMSTPQDRRAGTLFSHAAHAELRDGSQFVLPGFKTDRQAPALPLALYDLGLGQMAFKGGNPGAPLALRLFVSSILAVKRNDRHGEHPVALEVPLRKLLDLLYPGKRQPRPTEYWPRLMSAAEALDSEEARVPWYDPKLGRGGLRRIVSVGDIPRGPGALDDHVRIIIDLPPGSDNGPQVSDNLEKWGVTSAPAYRALLNLAYRWFNPGVTYRPLGPRADGKGQFWAQSDNPEYYERLTDAELVQTVFPTSARKSFRGLVVESHRVLAQLEKVGELRIVDGKVLPAKRTSLPLVLE